MFINDDVDSPHGGNDKRATGKIKTHDAAEIQTESQPIDTYHLNRGRKNRK